MKISIVDLIGQVVYQQKHFDSDVTVDLTDMDAGVYFVTLKSGDYSVTRKLHITK